MTTQHLLDLEGDDYLDHLFVWHVDDLLSCCDRQPLHPFTRLRMAHTLRILTLDGPGNRLAFHVQKRRSSQIIVLVADAYGDEEAEQNIPFDVARFFPSITEESHPPGIAYRPYTLQKYLDLDDRLILAQISFRPRAVITFLANKMGGSHLDADRASRIEYALNKWVTIGGVGAIYKFFDGCAYDICRALMPLRNEVAAALGYKEIGCDQVGH
ncbi:hypothetical protein [Bradyrhizobium sp. DASA03120]|uniref:hypothetical protein n=1 Tax=Bradyrhizobium sp. SMVTL-02 TaxID=3395917 RepID=UPI003F6F7D82